MLRPLTWLISLSLHASIAFFFLMHAGNAALEKGSGQDAMVVEQGIALEGMANLGKDEASVKAVEATPIAASAATPPEEVQPVEDEQVIASAQGPEQDVPFDPKPEEISLCHRSQLSSLSSRSLSKFSRSHSSELQRCSRRRRSSSTKAQARLS